MCLVRSNLSQFCLKCCVYLVMTLGLPCIHAGSAELIEKNRSLADVLSTVHVVEAKVSAIKDEPKPAAEVRLALVTMTVTTVYCGSGLKVGDNFKAFMRDGQPWYDKVTIEIPEPIPKLGDFGLWQVYPNDEGNGFHGNRHVRGSSPDPFEWQLLFEPFLGSDGRQLPEAATAGPLIAKALQTLVSVPNDKDRLQVLSDLARTDDPYAARVACLVLAFSSVDGKATLGRELFLDFKVPARAKMVIDLMLCRSAGAEWIDSKTRLDVFEKLVSGNRHPDEFFAVQQRLAYGSRDLHFSMMQCVNIVSVGLKNESFLRAYGASLWQMTSMIFADLPKSEEDRDLAFQYFVSLFKSTVSTDLQAAAAAALYRTASAHVPLSDKQVAAVKTLREGVKDKTSIEFLDLILKVAADGKLKR